MPSRPISRHVDAVLSDAIRAAYTKVEACEAQLWRTPGDDAALTAYQAACRHLEVQLGRQGDGHRHTIVVVIPVADSPRQLQTCLDSLVAQCKAFGYGGMRDGMYRKVRVLLADDSRQATARQRQRALARAARDNGLNVEYFGIDEQLALVQRLRDTDLRGIVGEHRADAFGHKGQAMMRNIAYLRLAELEAQLPDERLLFYTIDADQVFAVNIPDAYGGRAVAAINYFHQLDRLFDDGGVQILTGKVVGDPPVSPAVMAANFLDDVIAFVDDMRPRAPNAEYDQPPVELRGSGEAAYHDMAELFGFGRAPDTYRYRCPLTGNPDNAACFAAFAERLNAFFHGEHPTRVTWYRHLQPVADSVQPARTVYTGNYAFTPAALDWFIPFAPLRLRMSGPTMGRLLRAALGNAFVSANLPMLHSRTLQATGTAEFRPGVLDAKSEVDLGDEFERQFHGDVMLFTLERLVSAGYPECIGGTDAIDTALAATYKDMRERYRTKQAAILERLAILTARIGDPQAWWHTAPTARAALPAFANFIGNIERNFGHAATVVARIDSTERRAKWRQRQHDAIAGLTADRHAWQAAIAQLRNRAS